MAPRSSPLAAVAFALLFGGPVVLVGLPMGSAAPYTLVFEEWEVDGFPGWTIQGRAQDLSRDCARAINGCSLRAQPTQDWMNLSRPGFHLSSQTVAASFYYFNVPQAGQTELRAYFRLVTNRNQILGVELGPVNFMGACPMLDMRYEQPRWYRFEIRANGTHFTTATFRPLAQGEELVRECPWWPLWPGTDSVSRVEIEIFDTEPTPTPAVNFDSVHIWRDVPPPGPITTLVAGPGADVGSIHLAWSPPQPQWPLSGYRIYRGDPGTTPTLHASTESTTFSDRHLPPGMTYEYVVTALSIHGETQPGPARAASPRAEAVEGLGFDSILPAEIWSGWPAHASFRYGATTSQCAPTVSCPVATEWAITRAAAPGQPGSVPLAGGMFLHDGHAAPTTFTGNATFTPSVPFEGTHTLVLSARARAGEGNWTTHTQNVYVHRAGEGTIPFMIWPTLDRTSVFPGADVSVAFNYSVHQKRCPPTESCPTLSDWAIESAGSTLANGQHEHAAHGSDEAYSVATLVRIPDAPPGHTSLVARARAEATRPWTQREISYTILAPTGETTAPYNVVLDRDAISGETRIHFGYAVKDQRCENVVCPMESEWAIFRGGAVECGVLAAGTGPTGTRETGGTNTNDGNGTTREHGVDAAFGYTLDQVKVGVRAIAEDASVPWVVTTIGACDPNEPPEVELPPVPQ